MNGETRRGNLAFTAVVVVAITFLGKLLGFVREAAVAYCYSASYISDVYVLENGIVNAVATVVLCVVTATFVPTYVRRKSLEGGAASYANSVLVVFSVIGLVLTFILVFIPEIILGIAAPGFGEKYEADTMRIIVVSVQISMVNVFVLISQGVLRAILQANSKMALASFQGIIINICVLAYFLFLSYWGLLGLASAMVIAQVVAWAIFIVYIKVKGYLPLARISIRESIKDSYEMLKLSVPVLLVSVLSQASFLVDRAVASLFTEGTMAMIAYATTIGMAVNGLFGESINNVLYPKISELSARGDREGLASFGVRSFVLSSIPVVAAVICLMGSSEQVIRLVYERGDFSCSNTQETAMYLQLYMPGVFFYFARDFLNRVSYANQKTAVPAACAALGFVLAIVLNLTIPRIVGSAGVVIATSLSMTVSFFVQFGVMLFMGALPKAGCWIGACAKILISALFSGVVLGVFCDEHLTSANPAVSIVVSLVLGGGAYCLCLTALHSPAMARRLVEGIKK